GRPTVGVGDVGVGDASGVLAHHLEALLLEHDVEEIGDHAHLREVVRVEELDRLGEGVDLVGLAAVQRFEDRLEAVLGGEVAGEPHGAGELLAGCGGVDALGVVRAAPEPSTIVAPGRARRAAAVITRRRCWAIASWSAAGSESPRPAGAITAKEGAGCQASASGASCQVP